MKKVILFEQYLNESSDTRFTQTVLDSLEPVIVEMIQVIKTSIAEDYAKKGLTYKFTKFEDEMIRLGLIIDMLKSFEKYTAPTDVLVSIMSTRARKGIEINAVISRDGQEYPYYTEAIYAGGYNIQRLHLRYITKTNLPSPRVKSALSLEYEARMKGLTKQEKLNTEFQSNLSAIEANNKHIEWASKLTDDEIWQWMKDNSKRTPGLTGEFDEINWAEIVRRGADKNYKGEEDFIESQAKYKASKIDFFKVQHVKWRQDHNTGLEKLNKRIQSKLDALVY